MAQKRREESEFKVSDKRLFTSDGELRDSAEEQAPPPAAATTAAAAVSTTATSTTAVSTIPEAAPTAAAPAPESDVPEPPSASEQQAQHDAYRQSSRDLDTRVELSGHSAKELEMSFERFMASLYMTAMMQPALFVHQAELHHGGHVERSHEALKTHF